MQEMRINPHSYSNFLQELLPERCPPTGCEKSSGEAGGAAGGPQEECQNLLVSGVFCSQFMFGPGRTR